MNEYREKLLSIADERHKKFASALVPDCDNMLGIKIPLLREYAKQIVRENKIEDLMQTSELYFEETMLKGLAIDVVKDIDVALKYSQDFIPKISNWSLCDSFCAGLKIAKKHKEKVWGFLQLYLKSSKTYYIRFAVVMMLFHFVDCDYIDKHFGIFDSVKKDDYYVKMAVAWAVSVCFVKFPNQTMEYLENNKLDNETHNKCLQKICESLRVDKKTKIQIKQMKR